MKKLPLRYARRETCDETTNSLITEKTFSHVHCTKYVTLDESINVHRTFPIQNS